MKNLVILVVVCVCVCNITYGQMIDFETLPNGTPTIDKQLIFDEYLSIYGVTFKIIDPDDDSFTFIGYPQIAKKGGELTAFVSCTGNDTPLPKIDHIVKDSFLTDDGKIGQPSGDLLIEYVIPVRQAFGILLDVDKSSNKREKFLITAYDPNNNMIDSQELDSEDMLNPNIECSYGQGYKGEGDAAVLVLWIRASCYKIYSHCIFWNFRFRWNSL